ncbi:hypothetical protein [Flavobacterium luteolum]|uniref:hypothetical protein n=1 Tax=Flavobacterium luteolum TaxID=3003259 RepID=UPI00248EDFDC|nr:hypothetical protein [Flavobacterium luteolum]
MKSKLILAILLLSSCTNNKFSGYVYDYDTGKPIQNVMVNIIGNVTRTDSIGYFELEVNSNSNCAINLKRQGYAVKIMLRKPDFAEGNKNKKPKKNTIFMFKSDSDFSK